VQYALTLKPTTSKKKKADHITANKYLGKPCSLYNRMLFSIDKLNNASK
jgi:hypothetical protein